MLWDLVEFQWVSYGFMRYWNGIRCHEMRSQTRAVERHQRCATHAWPKHPGGSSKSTVNFCDARSHFAGRRFSVQKYWATWTRLHLHVPYGLSTCKEPQCMSLLWIDLNWIAWNCRGVLQWTVSSWFFVIKLPTRPVWHPPSLPSCSKFSKSFLVGPKSARPNSLTKAWEGWILSSRGIYSGFLGFRAHVHLALKGTLFEAGNSWGKKASSFAFWRCDSSNGKRHVQRQISMILSFA